MQYCLPLHLLTQLLRSLHDSADVFALVDALMDWQLSLQYSCSKVVQ